MGYWDIDSWRRALCWWIMVFRNRDIRISDLLYRGPIIEWFLGIGCCGNQLILGHLFSVLTPNVHLKTLQLNWCNRSILATTLAFLFYSCHFISLRAMSVYFMDNWPTKNYLKLKIQGFLRYFWGCGNWNYSIITDLIIKYLLHLKLILSWWTGKCSGDARKFSAPL